MGDIRLNNSGLVRDIVVSTLMKRYGLDGVLPAADIAFPVIVSHGNYGAVGLELHRVKVACGDLGDVHPATDIALPIVVPSHGDHGAVGPEPHRMMPACGDHDDMSNVTPIPFNFKLSTGVV